MIKKRTIFLYIIVFAVVNVAVAYWAFGILLRSVRVLSSAVLERQAVRFEYTARSVDAEGAKIALKNVQKDQVKLQTFFLKPSEVLGFILALEANAKAVNVDQQLGLAGSSADAKKPAGSQPTLSFSVSAKGSFPDLVSYLGLTENMPYFVSVSDLKFTVQPERNGPQGVVGPRPVLLTYTLTVATTQPVSTIEMSIP